MSSMTDAEALAYGNAAFRNTTYTLTSTLYLALFTTSTTAAGGGTEMSGSGYARQTIAFAAADGSGTYWNNATINFPAATASWATLYDWAIFTASTGGTMKWRGPLRQPVTLASGAVLSFAVNEFGITPR